MNVEATRWVEKGIKAFHFINNSEMEKVGKSFLIAFKFIEVRTPTHAIRDLGMGIYA